MEIKLLPKDLIEGYLNGIFPMHSEPEGLEWYAPDPRAIIPLHAYKPAKSFRQFLGKTDFEIRINQAFTEVMKGCAKPRAYSPETWINEDIISAYAALHTMGHAHSVETYQNGKLVGGLYGVAFGGAFFGESMFHTVSEASKFAFHHLIEILNKNQFVLLDTQFMNENVLRFGAVEIPRIDYQKKLAEAVVLPCHFQL